MTEKSTAAKSKVKKSECKLRKPLRDVSNKKKSTSNKTAQKQNHAAVDGDDNYSLDRLLLVQSEISSLLHQIDGLVVQAFKLESMGEAEKNQIKSFNQFLSATLESLKPWVPRFEKVLGAACKTSCDLTCHEIKCDPVDSDEEDELDVIQSPEVVKTKSLVSPSPLVSWRDNCTVQRGKRLFLLTPLPKSTAKSLMAKQHTSVKTSFEGFSSAVQAIPRFGLSEITCGDLLQRQHGALMDEKSDIFDGTETEKTPGCKIVSTPTFTFRDCSVLVMTPRLKMSPPKSCVLLEPVLESSHHGLTQTHKSTPYPAQPQHSDGSEISLCSSQVNEDIVFKCPELVGMNSGLNIGNVNKEADASLSWLMSPPKTCVPMEPSDLKNKNNPHTAVLLSANIAESDTVSSLFPSQRSDVQNSYIGQKFSFQVGNIPKGTPMWKNRGSTVRSGKRPGENTLKKELWTKFEAASSNDFSFYASPVENDSHKGFLDRLEEVSGEETIPLGYHL